MVGEAVSGPELYDWELGELWLRARGAECDAAADGPVDRFGGE